MQPNDNPSTLQLPFSRRGKLLVGVLRWLYRLVAVWKGRQWATPPVEFEENPRYMTRAEVVYLGYKYYFRPPPLPDETTVRHFGEQTLDFTPPGDFRSQSRITLSAGGDLMPYEWINPAATQRLWDETGAFFFGSDLVFANLETPIDTQRPPSLVPEVMLSNMLFNGSAAMFEIFSGRVPGGAFRGKGYDVVSTANNHSLDMGESGIRRTMDFLESRGVAFAGTARNAPERNRFPVLERRGIRVAFLAYTYSLNQFELPASQPWLVNHLRLNAPDCPIDAIVRDAALARQRADVVVVSLHAGFAYQPYPLARTVDLFHRIFEQAGPDIILGGHPHVAQPMEKYVFRDPFSDRMKAGFAVYSLADFVAYDIFVWDRLPLMLKLTIEKGVVGDHSHTQVTGVDVLPVYNWGSKDAKREKQLRFLDLRKTVAQVQRGQRPAFMTDLCEREVMELNRYWQQGFGKVG
ncbi:MAG: CapA family protein [Ferruginibacter sp.]|nr:CapA family protein [Cytophagales bacterium]